MDQFDRLAGTRAIIFGCGYLGAAIARLLLQEGVEVWAFRRSAEALQQLQQMGCSIAQGDLSRSSDFKQLQASFDFVVNVSASGGGDAEAYRNVYLEGNKNILSWLEKFPCRKFVYTSSTSVYAQNDGSRVDESSPAAPLAETGKILRQTEQLLVQSAPRIPAVILRLAGIYGPGRGFYLKKFLNAEPLAISDAERYANMIHQTDAATAVLQAIKSGRPGEIYNVTDDQPTQLLEMFTWFAQVTGKPLPKLAPDTTSAPRKRGVTNKIITNQKARTQLHWNLKFPTFKEGFQEELSKLPATQGRANLRH